MMPGLIDLIGKQHKTRTGDFSTMRWLKQSGVYIKIFLSWEAKIWKENGVRKVPEGGTTHQGAPGRTDAPWCIVLTSVAFLFISYFPNFSNIPKLTENIFADFSESVYLSYHIPPLFQDSGVFRKVSFMCSSGVMVWIILLSTLIGVPEI